MGNDNAQIEAEEIIASLEKQHPMAHDLIMALERLGRSQNVTGKYVLAQYTYYRAAELCEENEVSLRMLINITSGLAAAFDFAGREEDALPLYEQSIALAGNIEDFATEANLHMNLGLIFKNREEFSMAEEHYVSAAELFEKLENPDLQALSTLHNNLGGLYFAAGYPEQARETHLIALEMRENLLGELHPEVGQSLSNLATAYHELGDYENAKECYERALEILKNDEETAAIVRENFAELQRSVDENGEMKDLEERAHAALRVL